MDPDGIAWVTLNRPQKRNAMSPTLNREMALVLEALELDAAAKVLVLTGAGESWSRAEEPNRLRLRTPKLLIFVSFAPRVFRMFCFEFIPCGLTPSSTV